MLKTKNTTLIIFLTLLFLLTVTAFTLAGDYCPQCGAKVNPDDKFCSECGAKLDGTGPGENYPSGNLVKDENWRKDVCWWGDDETAGSNYIKTGEHDDGSKILYLFHSGAESGVYGNQEIKVEDITKLELLCTLEARVETSIAGLAIIYLDKNMTEIGDSIIYINSGRDCSRIYNDSPTRHVVYSSDGSHGKNVLSESSYIIDFNDEFSYLYGLNSNDVKYVKLSLFCLNDYYYRTAEAELYAWNIILRYKK